MKRIRATSRRRLVVALAATACLGVGLSGCSDDASSPDVAAASGSGGTGSTVDCEAAIPDGAVSALGWTPEGTADATADQCARKVGSSGTITAGTAAAVPEGDETAADAADRVLRQRCLDLRTDGAVVDSPATWLGEDGTASCALRLGASGTGEARLLVVGPDDRVYEYGVTALTRVDRHALEAGLAVLAQVGPDAL